MSVAGCDRETMKKFFDELDADGSGYLSSSEFATLIKKIVDHEKVELSQEQIDEIAQVSMSHVCSMIV